MSLLDGRHVVQMKKRIAGRVDEWGEKPTFATVRPDGSYETFPVRCTVQWGSAGESADLTVAPATSVTVIAREWPGYPQCRFLWEGREFEQVGPVRTFSGSPSTAHVEVFARLVSDEAIEDALWRGVEYAS